MVAVIVASLEAVRGARIAHDGVEVEDAVEGAAGANSLVQGLALGFIFGGVEAGEFGSAEGSEGRADDFDSLFVGSFDELALALDELSGGHDFVCAHHGRVDRGG